MSKIERLRKVIALAAVVILCLLFAAMVIVGIFFSKAGFGLFIGLIVGTTMFAVFVYVILMFLKIRGQNMPMSDDESEEMK